MYASIGNCITRDCSDSPTPGAANQGERDGHAFGLGELVGSQAMALADVQDSPHSIWVAMIAGNSVTSPVVSILGPIRTCEITSDHWRLTAPAHQDNGGTCKQRQHNSDPHLRDCRNRHADHPTPLST
jgi:hypothetical protein